MDKDTLLGPAAPIRGLCRMTTERAQRGYPLTRFCAACATPASAKPW